MRTSNLLLFIFLAANCSALLTQVINYLSIDPSLRTFRRNIALLFGVVTVFLTILSGWMLAVDWAALPKCGDESSLPGQLCDNGDVVMVQPKKAKGERR
jgi:hypothetical protein